MTAETDFATFVAERFGGKLERGSHTPNGAACFHEAFNVYRGRPWNDTPVEGLDLRGLNDAPWSSDAARTEAMLPLGPIVLAWPDWTPERRQAWAKLVAKGVIQRILPPTLRAVAERIPEKAPELVAAALRCEAEGTESAARSAESAAWSAESAARSAESAESAASAARSAAWSAESAARSAASAAWSAESAESAARSAASAAWSAESAARSAESAARSAESDVPLKELCRIMTDAEEQTRG